MSTSRLVRASVVLASIGLFGCHQAARNAPSGPSSALRHDANAHSIVPPAPAAQPPQPRIAQDSPAEPPAPGTAQALAQRAATYAQTVEPLIAKHSLFTSGGADWPDPDALHLTAQQPGVENPAADAHTTEANTAMAVRPPTAAKPRQVAAAFEVPLRAGAAAAPLAGSDGLAAKFAQRAHDYPTDVSAQIDDQLLKFLHDEPVPDMQSVAGLSPEDRELLSALMDSLTNFRNQLHADNNMLFSRKIQPLIELGDRLRAQAELSVPIVVLCSRVMAFGEYDAIAPTRFVAGTSHPVLVYYEVQNFSSQLDAQKMYETHLNEQIVLYTEASGLPVWSEPKAACNDLSHRRRHDFFACKKLILPATLTIGRYLLKVTIEDQQARRIAENTVPVEIVAQ